MVGLAGGQEIRSKAFLWCVGPLHERLRNVVYWNGTSFLTHTVEEGKVMLALLLLTSVLFARGEFKFCIISPSPFEVILLEIALNRAYSVTSAKRHLQRKTV